MPYSAENMIPFIDLAAQQKHIRRDVDKAIQAVLDHGQYIMGPEVRELEDQLAEFTGVKHAVSTSSGTDALILCLMALGLKPVMVSLFPASVLPPALKLCRVLVPYPFLQMLTESLYP